MMSYILWERRMDARYISARIMSAWTITLQFPKKEMYENTMKISYINKESEITLDPKLDY